MDVIVQTNPNSCDDFDFEEDDLQHIDIDSNHLACVALDHLRDTQGLDLQVVGEVKHAYSTLRGWGLGYHLYFRAKPKRKHKDKHKHYRPRMVFAEVLRTKEGATIVPFCDVMHSNNPDFVKGCHFCPRSVPHPKGMKFFKFHPDKTFNGDATKRQKIRCQPIEKENKLSVPLIEHQKVLKGADKLTMNATQLSCPQEDEEVTCKLANMQLQPLPYYMGCEARFFSDDLAFSPILWKQLAGVALQKYCERQGKELELVGEVSAYLMGKVTAYLDSCCFHLYFKTKTKDDFGCSPMWMFAEVYRSDEGATHVSFCDIMDPTNPDLLKGCGICDKSVLHPKGMKFLEFPPAAAFLRRVTHGSSRSMITSA